MLLVGNGTVFTLGAPGQVIPDGGVLVDGDTIVAVGPTADLRERADESIDAGGRVIMPGLICAHHHLYSTFACGLGAAPSTNFVQVLENLWWKLDRALDLDDVYYSAVFPLARCIRSGTTTLLDHHASPSAIGGSLGRIGDAVLESGLRASLCYEVTDRNGVDGARAGLAENRAWLELCDDGHSRLHGLVGIHAAMTVGHETMDACVRLAHEHRTGRRTRIIRWNTSACGWCSGWPTLAGWAPRAWRFTASTWTTTRSACWWTATPQWSTTPSPT
jgi:cytosine/adenosine deaminase-related metal-dependent hydrolase